MSEGDLKSRSFKRVESSLQKKLSARFLKNYPHHVMPGHNLNKSPCIDKWNESNVLGLYQDFPYSCDLPKPLLPPATLSRTVLSEEDPALQLLTIKNHLKYDTNRIINHYEKYKQVFGIPCKKKAKRIRKNNETYTKIPRYIADIAELLEMDPDPYFEGTYNWYYTGGSLNYIQLHDSDILLFPFMGELSTILTIITTYIIFLRTADQKNFCIEIFAVAANIVSMENSIWKPLLQNSAKYKIDRLLYEIRGNKVGDTCRILGRHKNQCNLYTLSNSENGLMLHEIHKKSSKIPYVSADLSLNNANQYCTLNAKRMLSLWDITSLNYISHGTVIQNNTNDDAWGSIRFQQIDPNILIYVDRCCLHYIDIRIPFDRPSLTLCPKFNLENCESLSVDTASKHNSCRYLGTYHSLLMCDNRSPKQCVRQKWTHQFKNTPLLAAAIDSDDKEIVVLSTQTAGENAIILNTWMSNEDSHSFNLPFTPPCISETLNESQMQGMCLNPYLQSRFELCNSGSTLVTNSQGEMFYFVQNSIGDIFYQCITHESALNKYSPANTKACYALHMWEKSLSAQPEPLVPLTLSHKCNMQYIFKNLTNKRLCLKPNAENKGNSWQSWKKSLATLELHTDILAQELLAAWEICEEISVPESAEPRHKVLNWLESATSSQPLVELENESEYTPTPINSQELISVSQEQDIAHIDDSNMLQEILLPKVVSKLNRKKRKT